MAGLAPLKGSDGPETVPDSYIVVFKKELSDEEASTTLTAIQKMFAEAGANNKIESNYDIGPNFRGFSAVMDADLLKKIRSVQAVKYVECNQMVRGD